MPKTITLNTLMLICREHVERADQHQKGERHFGGAPLKALRFRSQKMIIGVYLSLVKTGLCWPRSPSRANRSDGNPDKRAFALTSSSDHVITRPFPPLTDTQADRNTGALENIALATNVAGNAEAELPLAVEQLHQAALEEAGRVSKSLDDDEDVADKAGWKLIGMMLRVRETFVNPSTERLNEVAFEAFLIKNGAKKHGNVKTSMQRLSKVCFPKGTRADRVSKYGAALAALTKRNITSSDVQTELATSGEVRPGGPAYSGMKRFTLLHRQDMRLDRETEARAETVSNKFLRMPEANLKAEAILVIEALEERGLLPSSASQLIADLNAK
ncbi:hypothetical protein FIU28_02550 [Tardiphaga sp. vice154]|uniref:hypothetical protein n=1 Tax=Tardiphaga sp. vice154 TaxID=2592814 RepID=UPI0011632990|nr:hypothetical protein [Tardiphaga sp. vice154]QDM20160.1 hypothetical protein FIU28_02550 [Tardiphaga sp. vice154]